MSPKASDPDAAPQRKNPPAGAQDLRVDAQAFAAVSDGKPCEHGDCGLDSPWHCGCMCVRQAGADSAKQHGPPDGAGHAEAT